MRRIAILVASIALGAAAITPAVAASPGASPAPASATMTALELVRGLDARFADLPTMDEVQYVVSRTFSQAGPLAGSWIDVLDRPESPVDSFGLPAWFDIGGRSVEVMLVADCADDLEAALHDLDQDPCGWRHTWLYHVSAEGDVTLVSEAGAPDDGRPGTWPPLPSMEP